MCAAVGPLSLALTISPFSLSGPVTQAVHHRGPTERMLVSLLVPLILCPAPLSPFKPTLAVDHPPSVSSDSALYFTLAHRAAARLPFFSTTTSGCKMCFILFEDVF